jgi:lipopolysaccharide heptosyltransferase II
MGLYETAGCAGYGYMNKIRLLKSLDRILGKILVFIVPLIRKVGTEEGHIVRNILIIRPGGIGDAVLLLPALDRLKTVYTDSSIDVLAEKRNADVFTLSEVVRRMYLYDRGLDLMKCLRMNYDIVIDTEQWHRLTAVVAYLTGAPMRIGFGTNERRNLLTHAVGYSHEEYEIYSFLHLLEPLLREDIDFDVDQPFAKIDDSDIPDLARDMSEARRKVIAIFPGASVKERRWGGNKYGEVARRLSDEGYLVIILGSKADRHEAAEIKEHAVNSVDLTGKTSLKDAAQILKRCELLITADSGLMHIAYAVGTPTVSLFGSGIRNKWAPPGEKHVVIDKKLNCSPCTKFGYTPACKRGIECLSMITCDEVIDTAMNLLV